MKIFQNLFKSKRLTLNKENIPDFEKVAEFIVWYIKNEPVAIGLNNRSTHIIFSEGYRPVFETESIAELDDDPKINSILKWFAVKFFYDINMLKSADKDEFKRFLDNLVKLSEKTLSTFGQIGIKYNVNFEGSSYEKEIEKIPAGIVREVFKVNYLTDNVLGAELRIMAWLYHEYFSE